jgi:hypothetical protein
MPTFGYRRWLIFACKNPLLTPALSPLEKLIARQFLRPPPLGSPCQQGEPSRGSPHAVGGTYRRGVQQGTGTVPLPERYGRSSRARTLTP